MRNAGAVKFLNSEIGHWHSCAFSAWSRREIFLFTMFILYSQESEFYRYVLDGKSALAWELLQSTSDIRDSDIRDFAYKGLRKRSQMIFNIN